MTIRLLWALLFFCLCGCRPSAGSLSQTHAVKVAAVQFVSAMGEPELNRRRLVPLIREAARHQAKIVVLPEAAISGYMSADLKTTWQLPGWPLTPGLSGRSPRGVAEPLQGASTFEFARLARELGIYLTVPFVEVDPKSDRYFNTVALVDPEGRLVLHYRKLHPWPFAEQSWASPGDHGRQYLDTRYGRLALLICFDINFEPPELGESKVDLLLYSIAWVDQRGSTWFSDRLPAKAQAYGMHIIGANWTVPTRPDWHGYGHSLIIDKKGRTLSQSSNELKEEIYYAELE